MAASSLSIAEAKPPSQGSSKIEEVNRLLGVLSEDLEKKTLLPPRKQIVSRNETVLTKPERNQLLEQLKVLSREAENAQPLYSREAILTLCRHGFDGNSLTTGREALKCLANVMLLAQSTRQHFVDLDYHPKAAEIIKRDNRDDEFLGSRLLFLCTYETKVDFTDLFKTNGLAESLYQNLARHVKYFDKLGKQPAAQMTSMSLSETLKLFYNLSNFYPDQVPALTRSLLPICKIFTTIKLPHPPLQPPVSYIINSLLNLDLEDKRAHIFAVNPLFPKFDPRCNVNRLYSILDQSMRYYTEEQLESNAAPLITLIRHLYSFAPPGVQEHLRSIMLPSDEDRKTPLGRTETFSSYLLRLSLAGGAPQLRESVQNLLFELSEKDANKFVQNVGYGFAAGFLFSHNMAIPESATEAGSSLTDAESDGTSLDVAGKSSMDSSELPSESTEQKPKPKRMIPVNPVTGQRLDREDEAPMPEMTQEEKEREAERLFVLFERLKATGVVDVENPVIKAYQEGRIQELPDDEEVSD